MRPRIVALLILFAASRAGAQSWDETRRSLIDQATQARDRGELDRALQLARQAEGLRASPSLSLAIAEIEQAMQRPLAALHDARACVRALESDASARDRARLLSVCSGLVSTVEARVGRVTFALTGDPSNVEVRLDGRTVPRESWATGVEVLAGSVVVDVVAPGRPPMRREVTVAPRGTEPVAVALDAAPPTPPSRPNVLPPPHEPPAPARAPTAQGPGVGPWIVVGVGAASLALAGVFFGLREGALSDRDAICAGGALSGDDCRLRSPSQVQEAQSAQDRAVSFTTATYVSLGVGAAAVAGGLLWRALGPRRSAPATVSVSPLDRGAAGMLRVTF